MILRFVCGSPKLLYLIALRVEVTGLLVELDRQKKKEFSHLPCTESMVFILSPSFHCISSGTYRTSFFVFQTCAACSKFWRFAIVAQAHGRLAPQSVSNSFETNTTNSAFSFSSGTLGFILLKMSNRNASRQNVAEDGNEVYDDVGKQRVRRSHRKSRGGCGNCKRRRVKVRCYCTST